MQRQLRVGLLAVTWLLAAPWHRAAAESDDDGSSSALMTNVRELPTSAFKGVTMDMDVHIAMRDGVDLIADVYRPAGAGKFPVLVVRTPYLKSVGFANDALWWVKHGYAFVVQDVRGRGESAGEFYPLVSEADDGYDTQTWAGTQPWSTGRVGTLGGSYLGWTQVYPAGLNNPHLATMIPQVAPPDPFRLLPFNHGIPYAPMFGWYASVNGRGMQNLAAFDEVAVWSSHPLVDMDRRVGRRMPVWRDWMSHPDLDDYWNAQSYQKNLLHSKVPALYVSGWYDDCLVGTLENFVNMTTQASNLSARSRQWLLVGPWPHQVDQRRLGVVDFGPTAVVGFRTVQLQWFDHWLKGLDNGVERQPHVRIFVMGANKWQSENEWPIARTRYVKYFFHNNGLLSSEIPAKNENVDRFTYDPDNPTPFLNVTLGNTGGPDDYRQVQKRSDVLVYTSVPFNAPTEICGPLQVTLVAASSARDTDFAAMILDVHPDGYAQRLNDGIVRARFRNSDAHEEFLTPGKPEVYKIDAWASCVEVGVRHRLQVAVSSSLVPKTSANLNTGERIGDELRGVRAAQSVFHDMLHASYISVPIVPAPN